MQAPTLLLRVDLEREREHAHTGTRRMMRVQRLIVLALPMPPFIRTFNVPNSYMVVATSKDVRGVKVGARGTRDTMSGSGWECGDRPAFHIRPTCAINRVDI